jgi:hypothetical protein
MAFMLSLYGSNGNAKLLAKGGVCNGKFLERQVGGQQIIEIRRRKAK